MASDIASGPPHWLLRPFAQAITFGVSHLRPNSLSVEQYPAALHPKRRLGWPCELSPQRAPRVSISHRLAYPDFARACDLNARVCASWPWHFSDAYNAAHRGRRTPKNGQLRWRRHADGLNRHLSRYSNLNSRFADSPEMWNYGQTRYAPVHLPGHVARAMNSAPKVRQRFPAVRRSPSHPHPWLRPLLPCGQVNEGRSFPATGLSSGLQPDGANTRAHEKVRSWGHESDLPDTGL